MDLLWVDKYRPNKLDNFEYNLSQINILRQLAHSDDFPHLLFYGPSGAGKKTRVIAFLQEIYGSGVLKLKSEERKFKVSATSSNTTSCHILSSNYHLDLTPSEAEYRDKVIVQSMIKEVASTAQLDSRTQRDFKVIIINEVDKLTKEAQAALRRTMEKYVAKCRLVLICESVARVIAPLRSRCLMIRVPAPQITDITQILENIIKREAPTWPNSQKLCSQIAQHCDRNLRRSILQLQVCKMQGSNVSPKLELHLPEWRLSIRKIAENTISEQSPKRLKEIREQMYDLLVNCIPGEIIMKNLLLELMNFVDTKVKYEFIHWAAHHERLLQMGAKPIFHIEAFIARIMYIYKLHNQ